MSQLAGLEIDIPRERSFFLGSEPSALKGRSGAPLWYFQDYPPLRQFAPMM